MKKPIYLIMLTCLITWFSESSALEAYDLQQQYNNTECIECHQKISPALVKAWQNSSHAKPNSKHKQQANCLSCHAATHRNTAAKSRQNSTCIDCHGGKKAPVVHSYRNSKHGAIMAISRKKFNWENPLTEANYRVPGCAYCHMYNGQHDTKQSIQDPLSRSTNLSKQQTEQLLRKTFGICANCHAPRYIKQLFANGENMKKMARKKVNEAKHLIQSLGKQFSTHELKNIQTQFKSMQNHLSNVYLGIAHQSPDYQWWHGQPALDGDLLRIKSMLSELNRLQQIKKSAN